MAVSLTRGRWRRRSTTSTPAHLETRLSHVNASAPTRRVQSSRAWEHWRPGGADSRPAHRNGLSARRGRCWSAAVASAGHRRHLLCTTSSDPPWGRRSIRRRRSNTGSGRRSTSASRSHHPRPCATLPGIDCSRNGPYEGTLEHPDASLTVATCPAMPASLAARRALGNRRTRLIVGAMETSHLSHTCPTRAGHYPRRPQRQHPWHRQHLQAWYRLRRRWRG